VGYALAGNAVWIVAEHGRRAGYVRNLQANSRVRIKFEGNWHTGTAAVVADDDPVDRLTSYDSRTAGEVRVFGTSLLTIRVDLDD
jgi:deazaflavin-dependent oxidoreductase (nitroreductase family)